MYSLKRFVFCGLFMSIFNFAAVAGVGSVITDSHYVAGATMVFGRMSTDITSSAIMEEGFCFSTRPDPTVSDGKFLSVIDNNGKIYVLAGLTPASRYYIRSYVIEKDGSVVYGRSLRVYTLPKGSIVGTYDNKGSNEENTRINAALNTTLEDWNALTSIKGLTLSVHYSSGTPTADCSYGGWIRMGSNSNYQATGTIMHESLHAIGVGTCDNWTNTSMRSNGTKGYWLGVRANRVLQFWDNDSTEHLNGDTEHLWPYGCNGYWEDTHDNKLYYAQSLIAEALGEDGLPPVSNTYGTPAYTFDIDDTAKYYIKNEDEDCGLYTSYLVDDGNGQLKWKAMTVVQAAENSSNAAWTVSFDPSSQCYHFCNIGTGKYISYSASGANGFVTISTSSPSFSEDIHMLPYHLSIPAGDFSVCGYYMIHPEGSSPYCLTATAGTNISASTYSLNDAARAERWIILKADQAKAIEKVGDNAAYRQLANSVSALRNLMKVPHHEDVAGADSTFNAKLLLLEKNMKEDNLTISEYENLLDQAKTLEIKFLDEVTPSNIHQPFDLTDRITNAGFTSDASGWDNTATGTVNANDSEIEFYQTTFVLAQTLKNLPKGTFEVSVQGFQRPGAYSAVYADYIAGVNNVTAQVFAGSSSSKIHNIMDGAQNSQLQYTDKHEGSLYFPDQMAGARQYFDHDLYYNSVFTTLSTDGDNLRIGVRGSVTESSYWSVFDNFHLYFYGKLPADTLITGIAAVHSEAQHYFDVYNLMGQKVRSHVSDCENLASGIYIINGKKVIIR